MEESGMDDTFHVSAKGVLCEQNRILLIQYQEPGEIGYHYNLPGGRIHRNERAPDACRRKMREEAGARVDVVNFLFCYEYIGANHEFRGGDKHSISLVFLCTLQSGIQPSMSLCSMPDAIQTGVSWVALEDLPSMTLYPSCPQRIIDALRAPLSIQDRYWGDLF
jgi:8-oxo-dGTP diphosphatase